MREMKAYIRRSRVNAVVKRLQEAGAPGITIVEVHPVGYGYEPDYFEPGFEEDILKRYKYLEIVKLELVCMDNDLESFIHVIQQECQTGDRGDGWILRVRSDRGGSHSRRKARCTDGHSLNELPERV